jgi:GAF domain-containing protein
MRVAFFCGLERAPTFLVPIINPPFADNSPHFLNQGRRSILHDKTKLQNRYKRIHKEFHDQVMKTENPISRMSTLAALLHHKMPHYSWTGFYILDNGELTVGPYQGLLACLVLGKKRGVCWACIMEKKTIIVPDVNKFPGHIPCDERMKSEIVVPLFDEDGRVWAVLDVDSRKKDAFSEVDKDEL